MPFIMANRWVRLLGKYFMRYKFIKKIDILLDEGKVAKARTQAIKTLNNKAKNIANSLENSGRPADVIEASNSIDSFARVESQFGRNDYFDKSQVVSVTVHDVDDYVIELPVVISMFTGMKNYSKHNGLRAAKSHLKDVITKIESTYSRLKTK